MKNNSEDSAEISHIPLFHFPLSLTSYISLVHLLWMNEWILIHNCYLKTMLYSYFLSFYLMLCLCCRISSKIPHYILLWHLLSAVTVSQASLVFDDLNNFEEYWSGMLQNVPQMGIFYCFLLSWTWGYSFWEEDYYIVSRAHTINMTYHS